MIPQIFRGRTARDAQRAAIASLGAEAVILTTRKVSRGGLSGALGGFDIEVSAMPSEAPAAKKPSASDLRLPFAAGVYEEETPGQHFDLAQLRVEMRNEIRAVRSAITRVPPPNNALVAELALVRASVDRLESKPRRKSDPIRKFLESRGIEGPAAASITRALTVRKVTSANFDEELRDVIGEHIRVTAWSLADVGRSLIALVGPSGVGKTTTAAKLAAHAIRDGRTVTLIACDAFRVGAVPQLERYADLMGARFAVATNDAELTRLISCAKTDVVFVDTAGQTNPASDAPEACIARAATEDQFGRKRHVLLCVPASLRSLDAERVMRWFGKTSPTAMVITKLDETEEPGALLHGPQASGLPIAVLCNGPRVPEDVAPATRGAILDYLTFTNNAGHT